jgi:CHAD domain-containing protein
MIVLNSHDFFEQQYLKVVKGLKKIYEDPEKETVHDFRVDLKKMRSVFFLMEKVSGEKKIKAMHHQIRDIFRKAGHIREMQMEIEWLARHRKFDLIRHLQYYSKLKKSDKSFIRDIPAMLGTFEKVHHKMNQRMYSLTQEQSDNYVKETWQQTLHVIIRVNEVSDWHPTRKKIKQLLYVRNWVPKDAVGTHPVRNIFKSLSKLEQLIGHWHDLELLAAKLNKLDNDISGHIILSRELQMAKRKINVEKENLSVLIHKAFKELTGIIKAYH